LPFSTCSRYKHQPLHLQHDHHHQARRLKPRQIADAANRGCGKSRIHPNKTKKRTATDIVSKRRKASETGEANRVLINKNRCPQQDSSSTLTASRARRSLGPAPSLAAAQYGAYPVTPGLSGYARAIRLRQGYPATPGLFSDTSDIQRCKPIFCSRRFFRLQHSKRAHSRASRDSVRAFGASSRVPARKIVQAAFYVFTAHFPKNRSRRLSARRCRALSLRLRFFGKCARGIRTFVRPRPNRFSRTVPIAHAGA